MMRALFDHVSGFSGPGAVFSLPGWHDLAVPLHRGGTDTQPLEGPDAPEGARLPPSSPLPWRALAD